MIYEQDPFGNSDSQDMQSLRILHPLTIQVAKGIKIRRIFPRPFFSPNVLPPSARPSHSKKELLPPHQFHIAHTMSIHDKIHNLKDPKKGPDHKWEKIEPNADSKYMDEVLAHGMYRTTSYATSPLLTALLQS